MRNFNQFVVAAGVAAIVGLLGLAGTTASAENNFHPQPVAPAKTLAKPVKKVSMVQYLREKVRDTPNDGCGG